MALSLKIMSFNIRFGTAKETLEKNTWPQRFKAVLAVLDRHDADIMALQEALKYQVDDILRERPHLAAVCHGRDDGRDRGEVCAVRPSPHEFTITDINAGNGDIIPQRSNMLYWG
jgi:endonuclease/exonuclease/phosphatase family metal-dependent hydrolase